MSIASAFRSRSHILRGTKSTFTRTSHYYRWIRPMSATSTNTVPSTGKKNVLLLGGVLPPIAEQLTNHERLEVHPLNFMENSEQWLQDHGSSIDYIMTNYGDGLSESVLAQTPNVQLVSCNGVGYDSLPVSALVDRQMLVTHTPTVLDAETSTTAILLYLACYRDILSCERHARSGDWETKGAHPLTRTADGRKVGILGLGRIGQAIAHKLEPFGCQIAYHSRNPKPDVSYQYYGDLLSMAQEVDCLIAILPGGAETKHIVNQQVLEALGPDGVFINVARGSVVDEQALIQVLSEQKLGWAGLDVFEKEPHIPAALRSLPNVVLLPHVGSATHETRQAMGQLTLDNIVQHAQDGTVFTPVPECAEYAKTTPLK